MPDLRHTSAESTTAQRIAAGLAASEHRPEAIEACRRMLAAFAPIRMRVAFNVSVGSVCEWRKTFLRRLVRFGAITTTGNGQKDRCYVASDHALLEEVIDVLRRGEPWFGKHAAGRRVKVTASLRNLIDGLMLGDGTMDAGRFSANIVISQHHAHEDWISDIANRLDAHELAYRRFSAPACVWTAHDKPLNVAASRGVRTLHYRDLLAEASRWYPTGKKAVPRDVFLSDRALLADWYMGDGNLSSPHGRPVVKLHTNGFQESDVEFLRDGLKKTWGWHPHISHWRGQPILTMTRQHDARAFCDVVRPFLLPSFSYKAAVAA